MPRPPTKVLARAVALVVVLTLAVGLWTWWRHRDAAESGPLALTGSVQATEYQVAPATAGTVTAVNVAEGDRVRARQPLVVLDARALDLQVTQAQEGVRAAKAAVDAAEDDDSSDAEVTAAQARLAQARAAVDLAKVQQGYATVTAPHAGTVATLVTNVGQNASPARVLLTLVDTSDLWVRVYVPETRLGEAKVGARATVSSDSTPDAQATVSSVASTAEFTPNTVETEDQRTKLVYEVRLRVTTPAGDLKPGMPVTVTFS
ncbi:efflux RND transporter periplasmic adaptor subunit [Mobilicoccus sp.]|uniref:HlyD family secretion protein n=1 Tax=Mobilicoccus sp. TaxID=2034349 RepID=UPI002897A4A7|nr:efflux RND transporter periplasmic adaptor subunit [Mobilicoccus sp.]